jgi:hypothetical protein
MLTPVSSVLIYTPLRIGIVVFHGCTMRGFRVKKQPFWGVSASEAAIDMIEEA